MLSCNRRTALLTLTIALVLVVHCEGQPPKGPPPPPGGQQGGQKPDQPGKPLPPLQDNKKVENGGKGPPPKVDRSGGKQDKFYLVSSGGFNIEVNGKSDMPVFKYWSSEANIQRLALTKMWQTTTPDNVTASKPQKMVNLKGMYTWEFGDASETVDANVNTTDVSFTMTGTPRASSDPGRPTPGLVFNFHLLSNGNGTEMKFDISITDFKAEFWASPTAALVLAYRVSTVDKQDTELANATLSAIRLEKNAQRPNKPTKSDGTNGGSKPRAALDFGNGNGFEIVSTATDGSGAAKSVSMTALSTPNEGTLVLNMYEKFDTSLNHDPSCFTASTSSTVSSSATQISDISLYSNTMIDTAQQATGSDTKLSSAASKGVASMVMGTTLLALLAVLVTSS